MITINKQQTQTANLGGRGGKESLLSEIFERQRR
jgi:hypothetical protein